MKKALLSIAAIAVSLFSFAHEGHGHTDGFSIRHYFVEPDHLAIVVLSLVAIVAAVRYFKKRSAKDNA